MKFKRPIYRYLFYTGWLVLVGGVIMLLVSANRKSQARTCQGMAVSINNGGERIYVEKEDVLKNIEKTAQGPVVKKITGDINLAQLEMALENNPWIRDAEMYFDTKDVLHVSVAERVPVARVFTTNGSSFYIDSAGYQLPLLENYSAKLPVVTGFTAAKKFNKADSAQLQQTKEVVQAISADPFWNAQVGQIDITPAQKFELIPVVGNHVIRLGAGHNVAKKLAKLMLFYKQVLPKAGLAKYSALDLQFEGQVVAVKRGPVSKVDSIQLQKNIEQLMQKKLAEQEPDNPVPVTVPVQTFSNGDFEVEPVLKDTVKAKPPAPETSTTPPVRPAAKPGTMAKPSVIVPATVTVKAGVQKPKVAAAPAKQKKKEEAKPKAVMPPRVENDY